MQKIMKLEIFFIIIIVISCIFEAFEYNNISKEIAGGNYIVVNKGKIVATLNEGQIYTPGNYEYIEYEPILVDINLYENKITETLIKDYEEFRFISDYKIVIDYVSSTYYPIYYYVDEDESVVIDCIKTKSTKEWATNLKYRKTDIISHIINNGEGLEYLDNKEIYSKDHKYIIDLEKRKVREL